MKRNWIILLQLCLGSLMAFPAAQAQTRRTAGASVPPNIQARIIRLEDERNPGGNELETLLKHNAASVRERAAMAIGRTGDKRGTDALIAVLEHDDNPQVRAMTAFALGEMEDALAVAALMSAVEREDETTPVRARAAEALGKIAGVQANADALGPASVERITRSLSAILPDPGSVLSPERKLLASLTIAALMRVRSPSAVEPLVAQLKSGDPDLRAQAANALARLRQPIAAAVPALIEALGDDAPETRANAARALGTARDARAVEPLIRLLTDGSDQALANAIRALGALNDRRATDPLLAVGTKLLQRSLDSNDEIPSQLNLLLEIATTLGAIKDPKALPLLKQLRRLPLTRLQKGRKMPPLPLYEVETAIARFGETAFFDTENHIQSVYIGTLWLNAATIRGLGQVCNDAARGMLLGFVSEKDRDMPAESREKLMPEALQSLANCKYDKLPGLLRRQLAHRDPVVRAAAAGLLADIQSDENLVALAEALKQSRADVANDAKLAILSSVAKYKDERASAALKSALEDRDHLVRRHAVELLKQSGVGDFSSRIGPVETGHDNLFYQGLVQRQAGKATATIHTRKGPVNIELFSEDAPVTVDNFIRLVRKGYFNGIAFHRVVPNFVIQGGDPRGDGEGGPGYQIRCEVNTRPYIRGAVGMALSGKDTGGSQFFITHSPQPHLDGGYTVFGQVTGGMDVVDRIARGDVIERIVIVER